MAQQARSSFEPARPASGPAVTAPAAPASSLLTENASDGSVNCLDVAADWVNKASPELRARSELVFLQDSRAGTEGQTGHVLVRQGERVLDPTTRESYPSLSDYQRAHPEYREVGTLPATSAARIFSTPAGSPERAQALAQARVPEGLQRMMVADTPATPAPRTLDPESVARAEQDYALLEQAHHLGQPLLTAQLLHQNAADADYQAHLIGLMKEGGEGSLLNNVVAGFEGLFTPVGEGSYRNGTDADRQAMTDALSAAREAGTLSDADLQAMLAASPGPWNDAISRLGFTPVQRTEGANAAVEELEGATGTYESAREAAQAKDEELARQLASFGPALDERQVAHYVAAFRAHPDNAEAYQELEAAAAALADVVRRQGPALENAAITRPEDAAALTHSLELLASSSQAAVAVELGARALADPASPLGQALTAVPDFEARVLEQGIPNAASQLLAQAATPEAAFAELQRLLGPLGTVAGGAAGARTDITDALSSLGAVHRLHRRLLWGAAYGAERFLSRAPGFKVRARRDGPPGSPVLRELVLERTPGRGERAVRLTLHAYAGEHIGQALEDFLHAAAGRSGADLVVWAGHDVLMDQAAPTLRTALVAAYARYQRITPRAAGTVFSRHVRAPR